MDVGHRPLRVIWRSFQSRAAQCRLSPCQIELSQYTVHTGRALTDELHHVTVRSCANCASARLTVIFFPLRSFQTQMCSEESKNVLSCYLVFCAPVRQSFHFIRQPSIGHHVQSDILVLKCTWHVLHKRWWITMSVFYVDNAIPVKTLHFYKGHMLTDQFKGESCWSVAAFPWGEALNKFK